MLVVGGTLASLVGCGTLANYTTTTVRCSGARTLKAVSTKKFVLTSELTTIGVLLQQNDQGVGNIPVRLSAPAGRFVGPEAREFEFTTGPDGRLEALWRAPTLPGLTRENPDGPWKYQIEVTGFATSEDPCTGYLSVEVGR